MKVREWVLLVAIEITGESFTSSALEVGAEGLPACLVKEHHV